ncbi:hypothetical protein AOG25_08505 [Vibrio alginolyticus]|nr:hypothetical protein AOG25_08505 [Vibrio alginolyticus]
MNFLKRLLVGSVATIALLPLYLIARFYRQLWIPVGLFCVYCFVLYDHVNPLHWIRVMPFKDGYLLSIFGTGIVWAIFEKIFDDAANTVWYWIRLSWN